PPDANNLFDVYLHDRATGSVALVSLGGAGQQGDGDSYDAVLAASSSSIAFVSTATNLVAGDLNANEDVFVRDLPSFPSVVIYCTAGTSSNGCVATMSASGTPSASASSGFVLSA